MNKSILFILLVAVAAAEGRARGAKLGHRSDRQQALWGRPRQEPYPQTPAVAASGYPQPQESGPANTAPAPALAPAPAPVYPSVVPSTGAPQAGYPVGEGAPQIPIVVPGNISPASIPKCQYPGFFATPGSCVNFYRCVDWTGTGAYYSVFQFNCPPGTIFDDQLDICSHIAWVVPKRPECESMLSSSLVPLGSGPPAPGTGGAAPGSGYGPGVGIVPQPPVLPPLVPAPIYPQPGGGHPVPPVSPGPVSDGNAPPVPFTLQCFSGEAYRRHPLYCNRYYRCQWDGSDWVFPMVTCPRGLIFDEAAQSCADPATVARCPGQIAPEPSPEGVEATESTTVTDTTPTEESATTPMVDPSSLYDCPAKGYYPFEGDCIRFYKCVELESGFLKGLLYKCPEQYGYSEQKRHCDKEERLPTCTKTTTPAHLRHAPARELTVEDLEWFFNE